MERVEKALGHLKAAEEALGTGDPESLPFAREQAREAIQSLEEVPNVERLRASAWLALGHTHRETGTPESRREAVEAYDQAIRLLDGGESRGGPDSRNQEANVWTNRGIAQLVDEPAAAIESFDRAIELRRDLPLAENPVFRWGLAAACMNRADALARVKEGDWKAEAARSADEAIAQLAELPLDEIPAFRSRLAIAWMNRGLFTEELDSLDRAAAVLRDSKTPGHPEHRRTLACVCFNQGQMRFAQDPALAVESARECLALLEGDDAREAPIAELGVNARHLLARCLATMIEAQSTHEDAETWFSDATDAVEEALGLSFLWETRGFQRLRPAADELFGFGARLYRMVQPHFLAEFITEYVTPDRVEVARRELALAMERLRLDEEGLEDSARARRMQIWSELQATVLVLAQG